MQDEDIVLLIESLRKEFNLKLDSKYMFLVLVHIELLSFEVVGTDVVVVDVDQNSLNFVVEVVFTVQEFFRIRALIGAIHADV